MIVECINDNWRIRKGYPQQTITQFPIKGYLYHVTDTIDINGEDYYELFEIRKDWVWAVANFKEVEIDISNVLIEEEITI